jgi:hypothetical protein
MRKIKSRRPAKGTTAQNTKPNIPPATTQNIRPLPNTDKGDEQAGYAKAHRLRVPFHENSINHLIHHRQVF